MDYERKIELGSQLFINRRDDAETVRAAVRQFAESGLKVIRLFLFWDYVERFEDVWDFSQFDACFEQAEESGVQIVPTLMPVSPPGYMCISSGVQDIGDLNDPVFWTKAMEYVRRTVQRYHASPALHSWILWNEPTRHIRKTEHSIRALREYLRKYYGNDIGKVNKLYYNRYNDFDEIEKNYRTQVENLSFRGYSESTDWTRFSCYDLCEKLSDIGAEIRKWDDHPIHVNPHDVGRNIIAGGQSVWQEAKVVDFIGCSCHPSWHSTRFDKNRIHQSVSMFTDLMGSATRHPDKLFWVTELQGGNNIFSGIRPMSPTKEDISRWIWLGLGCGAEKIVFWCFNTRNEGFEGAEWGLLGFDGRPSPRLEATSEICRILEREQSLLRRVRPEKPQVYILHAESSWILSDVEGEGEDPENPRNRMLSSDAVAGAYQLCQDMGLQVGFVSEDMILDGELPEGVVLLAPSVFACRDGVCEALEGFVRRGGTLIADQMFGIKDEYGRIRYERSETLERIFGVRQRDLGVLNGPETWQMDGLSCPAWFMRMEGIETEAAVLGRFADGAPALLRNPCGEGAALRFQTTFFQRYGLRHEAECLECMRALLDGLCPMPDCRLDEPSASLTAKLLSDGEDRVFMVFNTAENACEAVVTVPEGAQVRWLTGMPASVKTDNGKLFLGLEAGASVVAHIFKRSGENDDENDDHCPFRL